MNLIRILALTSLLLLPPVSHAQAESVLRDAGPIPLSLAGAEDPQASKVFIVQLKSPSAARR